MVTSQRQEATKHRVHTWVRAHISLATVTSGSLLEDV